MKATISIPGDTTAGIREHTITVDGLPEFYEDDARGDARDILQRCFAEYLDNEGVDVVFDDECADCLVINGHHHKDCPNSQISETK